MRSRGCISQETEDSPEEIEAKEDKKDAEEINNEINSEVDNSKNKEDDNS